MDFKVHAFWYPNKFNPYYNENIVIYNEKPIFDNISPEPTFIPIPKMDIAQSSFTNFQIQDFRLIFARINLKNLAKCGDIVSMKVSSILECEKNVFKTQSASNMLFLDINLINKLYNII